MTMTRERAEELVREIKPAGGGIHTIVTPYQPASFGEQRELAQLWVDTQDWKVMRKVLTKKLNEQIVKSRKLRIIEEQLTAEIERLKRSPWHDWPGKPEDGRRVVVRCKVAGVMKYYFTDSNTYRVHRGDQWMYIPEG